MKNVSETRSHLAKFMVAAGFFALSCVAISGNALAQEPTAADAPSEHANSASTHGSVSYPVGYSDLDVSKIKGAKTLYLRIQYAAEVVCQSAATWGKKEAEACVRKAVNEAVARVDVPLLSQYHQLRSKGDKAGLVQLARAN